MAEVKEARQFINYINDNYQSLKKKYFTFCKEKDITWSEDIFSDTIVKCYDTISRNGKLNDTSNQGMENYFFRAFKQNLQRETQYCRTKDRDLNVTSDDVSDLYENWYNNHNDSSIHKLKKDLFTDFSVLYIMFKVEENFDAEHSYLFRTKYLCNLTYKQLQKHTKMKGCRMKVLEVKNWVKENVSKEEIVDAFNKQYSNLM